ncbi:putative virion structural protein [Erwinia phage vB_EamM_Bosolaphorus]|uniref:Putative virion structural protein n=2 Tax=Agricanvirus TaxID=1984776 RepID=A0A173GDV9_9CAUD|nr:putative virion structural protein [Erwinia phage vB_EamM_Simmy50]ANH51753.1 putative virion structural protein [Erwinia phage vB_EamM_Simmy50]AUG86079.1 putative virion structural protein [Erwinia phage vB_EamM_Bosolaphorus]
MSDSIDVRKQKMIDLRNDPSLMMDYTLDLLDQNMDGTIDIMNATNPAMFAFELVALTGSAVMQNHEDLYTAYYPKMARTYEDLYRNMSDEDYKNRFCTPSRITTNFIFNADEIRARAVQLDSSGNDDIDSIYSKMVIPRNTEITVMDVTFSLEYPIEIRVMKHGGFVVVYDVSQPSPLLTVETNQLTWRTAIFNGVELLYITVPLRQFKAQPYYGQITSMSGYRNTYPLKGDQFYYLRVFTRANVTDEWEEAYVTHDDLVYDNTKLTFVAQVLEDSVKVVLPEIYISNNLAVGRQVRADVYTSKGNLVIETLALQSSSISAVYRDFNYEDRVLDKYSTPLTVFNEKTMSISSGVSGGVNGLSVEALREAVIYSANKTVLPITEAQVSQTLVDLGYGALKSEDTVTQRIYHATRSLNPQTNKSGINTPAGTGIITLQSSMLQLVSNTAVRDNGNRITITPTALYRLVNGIYNMVSDAELATINGAGLDSRALTVNNNVFMFSPFYMVLDANNDAFTTRVYDLDRPSVAGRVFSYENNSIGVELVADSFTFTKTTNGFRATVVTSSGDYYKDLADSDVACQLLFMPEGESNYGYLNGLMIGRTATRERVWQFDIDSNLDITNEDEIILTSFGQFGNAPSKLRSVLEKNFILLNCIAVAKSPNDVVYSDSDKKLGSFYLDQQFVVVTEQSYDVVMGKALTYLYQRSRSVVSDIEYQKYDVDVPWRYAETVYQRDAVTNQLVFDSNNQPIILHAKGDIMYDADNNIIYRYRVGDIKSDEQGNPIPLNERVVVREIDVVGLDGVYYFTGNPLDKTYITDVISDLVDWVTEDMVTVKRQLLEKTTVSLRPKQTLGLIDVIANARESRQISAAIGFDVTFYMTDNGYKNTSLRDNLSAKVSPAIAAVIARATFGLTDLVDALKPYRTSDVVDIEFKALGVNGDIKVMTALDDTMRCAIKKRVDVASDETLTVKEDISITFLKHTSAKSSLTA